MLSDYTVRLNKKKGSTLSSNKKTGRPMTQYSKQARNALVSPYPIRLHNIAFSMFRAQRSYKWNHYVNRRKHLIHFITYKINADH